MTTDLHPTINDWLKDDDFNALPYENQQRAIGNFFDTELADDEFNALDPGRQVTIRDRFVGQHIDVGQQELGFQDVLEGTGALARATLQVPEKDQYKGPEPSVVSEVVKGVGRAGLRWHEAANTGLQWLGNQVESGWLERKLGIADAGKEVADWAKGNVAYIKQKQKDWGLEQSEKFRGKNVIDNPEILTDPAWLLGTISEFATDMGAMILPAMQAHKLITAAGKATKMAPALIKSLADIGSKMTGGAIGVGLETSQTYQDVLEKTGSHEEATLAAGLFAPAVFALNAFSVGKIMQHAGKGFLAKGGKALVNFLTEGGTEALEEPAEVAAKMGAKIIQGKPVPENWKDMFIDSMKQAATVFIPAGLVGGGMGMVTDVGGEPGQEPFQRDIDPTTDISGQLDEEKALSAKLRQDFASGKLTPDKATAFLEQAPPRLKTTIESEIYRYNVEQEAEVRIKEKQDAETIRRSAEEISREEGIEREEEIGLRVRDAEKDRVEAAKREAKEPVEPPTIVAPEKAVPTMPKPEEVAPEVKPVTVEAKEEVEKGEPWEIAAQKKWMSEPRISPPEFKGDLKEAFFKQFKEKWDAKAKPPTEPKVAPEVAVEEVVEPDVVKPLPDFKSTEEALEFGKKATPEQQELLEERRAESVKRARELTDAGELDAAMVEGTKGQFDREALESVPVVVEEVKEPYMMGREEFANTGYGGDPTKARQEQLRGFHETLVKDALEDGDLTPEQYAEIHEAEYGKLEDFAPEAVKEPTAPEVKKPAEVELAEIRPKSGAPYRTEKAANRALKTAKKSEFDYDLIKEGEGYIWREKAEKPSPAQKLLLEDGKVTARRRELLKDAPDFRTAVKHAGGLKTTRVSYKGEFRDITKGPGAVSISILNNKTGLGTDEMTLSLIEAGWLPKDATEDDLIDYIVNNPTNKISDYESEEYLDKLQEEEYLKQEDRERDAGESEDDIRKAKEDGEREADKELEEAYAEAERKGKAGEYDQAAIDELDLWFKEQQPLFGKPEEKPFELTPEELTDKEKLARAQDEAKRKGLIKKGKKPVFQADKGIKVSTVGKQRGLFENDQGQIDIEFEPSKPPEGAPAEIRQEVRMSDTGGTIRAASWTVRDMDEAASLFSKFTVSPQENLFFLTTDKNGKVLEVHHYSKGHKTGAEVRISESLGHVFNIPDAHTVYYVHNHPSGDPTSSPEDVLLQKNLRKTASLSGLEIKGFIIGRDTYAPIDTGVHKPIKKVDGKVEIPIKERGILVRRPNYKDAQKISLPAEAIKVIKDVYQNREGFLLLDRKNQDIGFLPFVPGRRMKDITRDLIAITEKTNASYIIFNSHKNIEPGTPRAKYLEDVAYEIADDPGILDIVDPRGSHADLGLYVQKKKFAGQSVYRTGPKGITFQQLGSEEPLYQVRETYRQTQIPEGAKLGVSVKGLENIVKRLQKQWNNAPEFVVVKAQPDLPAELQKAHKVISGVYHKNKVYLVADNMLSMQFSRKTIAHETLGHYGFSILRQIPEIGTKLDAFMARLYKTEQKAIDDIGTRYGYDVGDAQGLMLASEEFLARKAETDPQNTWVKQMISLIRQWIAKTFPNLKVSRAEVSTWLGQMQRAVVEGAPGAGAEGVRYQSRTMADPFFSQLIKSVTDNIKQMPAKVQSITKWLQKQQVKPAEMKWMGVEQWMKENQKDGKIDRDAFLEFLKGNDIEVREVVKGGEDIGVLVDRMQELENREQPLSKEEEEELKSLYLQHDKGWDDPEDTKFAQYQLPGGEAYREMVFVLPRDTQPKIRKRITELNEKVSDYTATKEEQIELNQLLETRTTKDYQSAHYDEPNVLAHVRWNERTDAEGNRVLFIEEVQSDWLQEAKEKGFASKRKSYVVTTPGGQEETFDNKADAEKSADFWSGRYGGQEVPIKIKETDVPGGVPKAPFLDTWHEYVMKRMLRMASEQGFDKLAWTKGKHQIDRYEHELRKSVDQISWEKTTDGKSVDVFAYKIKGEDIPSQIFSETIPLTGTTTIAGKEVALKDVVGKPLAQQIVASKETRGEFKGDDLSIGGMGMRSFYDELIPGFLKKYGKQWGAEVSTTDLDIGKYEIQETGMGKYRIVRGDGHVIEDETGDYRRFSTKEKAEQYIKDEFEGESVHSIPITPEMKESVLFKGQPRWQMAPTKDLDQWAKDYLEEFMGAKPETMTPAAGEKKHGFHETLEPLTEEDYAEARKDRRDIKLSTKNNVKRVFAEIAEGVDKYMGSISTRLGQVSKKLKAKLRKLDFDIGTQHTRDVKRVEPLLRKALKMSKDDFADWDYARRNSGIEKIHELIEKYDMQTEYDEYRQTLNDLRAEGLDVGLEIGLIEEYAPRSLKDSRGFLTAIGKAPEWPIYTRRLEERARDLGFLSVEEIPLDMRAEIISNMILGGWTGLGGVSATKERKLKKVPAYLNQYYMDSDSALMKHLYDMRKLIEGAKFFGKIPQKVAEIRKRLYSSQRKIREANKNLGGNLSREQTEELRKLDKALTDGRLNEKETKRVENRIKVLNNIQATTIPEELSEQIRNRRNKSIGLEKQYTEYINKYATQRDYKANIGTYVSELITDKEIEPKHERIVNEILNARFHERGTRGVVQAYKNISYMDTMGSPVSALTQIGDLAWAYYNSGVLLATKHAYRALTGKKRIVKEDIGITRIAQEFADSGTLGNAVTKVFKWVGLEKIDSIGKEALLNSTLEKHQKQAKKNPAKLKKEISGIFENETDGVIEDLASGTITDNVKLLVYSRLLDFQPVALSEMPQKYLDAGNGRIFYMLKTFTLKVFDVYRNEIYYKIRKGDKAEKIQGMKNLVMLTMFFVLANAGADELKDWLLGRKTDFNDRVTDNILRLFGISKFVTWKARTEGVGSALFRQILPPFKFIDSAGKDILTAGDEKGLEMLGSVPLIGKLAYWHIGRGTRKREDLWNRRLRKEKSKLNKVKAKLETSEDKPLFRQEHREDLLRLRSANRLQGRLNRYRKRINKLKSLPETKERKKRIQYLEKRRTELIKTFLKR